MKEKSSLKDKLATADLSYPNMIELMSLIVIVGIIFSLLLFAIATTYGAIRLNVVSYLLMAYGILSIIIYALSKIKNFKFSKYEIFIFVLALLTSLSMFGAIDKNLALWGTDARFEGLYVILSYYSFALLASNIRKDIFRKIIVYCILFVGLANIIYGLMQTGIIKQNIIDIKGSWHYAKGFNGNSMFYASLLSICYPITMSLFIKSEGPKATIFSTLLLLVFTVGVLNSGSMAVFLSSILVLALLVLDNVIAFIKEKKKKKKTKNKKDYKNLLKVVAVILIFISVTVTFRTMNKSLNSDVKDLLKETKSVAVKNKVDDSFGTGRIHIWKATLPRIKKYWLFGAGVDNYLRAFDEPVIDVVSGCRVDKAHNEYLQKALCEGVISAVMYILFLLLLFFKGIKNKEKYQYGLLLGFTCYCIQAFFGISVTRVSPIFYIVIGLLIASNIQNEKKKS